MHIYNRINSKTILERLINGNQKINDSTRWEQCCKLPQNYPKAINIIIPFKQIKFSVKEMRRNVDHEITNGKIISIFSCP